MNTLDVATIKQDFPIFKNQRNLVYLDTAASALTPKPVIDALRRYYEQYPVNVARGLYTLSERATQEYENARADVARFIGARDHEIVFTSGTTHALNIVAHGLAHTLASDANIVVTMMDHHANFVPWHKMAKNIGCEFRVVSITQDGQLDMDDLRKKVDARTAVFAFPYISNVLGAVNPVKEIITTVKKINPNIITVVDAAQAAPHMRIDVNDLGCDFLAFSGHKLYGPTGIGVLWGKKEKLEILTPLLTGGEMVQSVTCKKTTFKPLPHRLEAGTPPIAQAIGLGAAVRYLESIGMDVIAQHDAELTNYTYKKLTTTFGENIILYGPPCHCEAQSGVEQQSNLLKKKKNRKSPCHSYDARSGLISFSLTNIHPHDIAHILDDEHSVAIRAGAHCAQPLHTHLDTNATARISFGIYTTREDIDTLIAGLKNITDLFHKN